MADFPSLPEVTRVVDRLAHEVLSTPSSADALWNIYGPATGGKSTALRLLAERLAEERLAPVLIQPPSRALDAGPLALVDATASLSRAECLNGSEAVIRSSSMSWSQKLYSLLDDLKSSQDRVVILCDEPEEWPSRGSEDMRFAEHAREAAFAFLGGVRGRRVVTGRLPPGMRASKSIRLDASSDPSGWLRAPEAWGSLASAAERAARLGNGSLRDRSPLELRLLVALIRLRGSDDISRWWNTHPTLRDIARQLAEAVHATDDAWASYLRETWSRLCLVRRPISQTLLRRIEADGPKGDGQDILTHCLLYQSQSSGDYVMHWIMTLVARERGWLDDVARQDAHRSLAQHYLGSFSSAGPVSDGSALTSELEAFHHASLSGDALDAALKPYFADQLNALGRVLSHEFNRYDEAANVFRRACEWEPNDDYAHHYLAYNLDIQAKAEADIEKHYQEAIRLRPENAWWHSRWINYLITRGRTEGAKRAWKKALDALGLPDPNGDQWIYENLHVWVTRLLVHRGQVEFAQEVIGGIPESVLSQHPGLSALTRRLTALIEARRVGATFPLSIPPSQWWEGPHLCPQRSESGSELERWLAGRVDAIDEAEVHLQVSEGNQTSPEYGFLSIPVADFDGWSGDERVNQLSAGRFLELAWYGKNEPLIRVHRQHPLEDQDLPPLFPDSARYLRNAGWIEDTE